ncbi:hypothetical protein [Nonomuraea endophytica]|uniref:hypothetical protein n=1 Tax=Nonomuraea endophytica TaxID=714136 RepID=UPI0037CBAC8F
MNIINGKPAKTSDDVTGDVGTVVSGHTGPVHLGKGNVSQGSKVISGDGAVYVAGDNPKGISKSFGTKRKRK